MKLKLFIYSAGLLALASANASSVFVRNSTEDEDAAYGLFDASGNLLSALLSGNVRLGTFASGFDVTGTWSSGDLSALDTNFVQFGSSGSMLPSPEMDGLIDAIFSSSDSFFADLPIVLWISNSADFLNPLGQHLIFQFGTHYSPSTTSNEILNLSPDSGILLVGDFAVFSHDYGFGGGVLPGFNLEAVVPEPATYALIIGTALAGMVALRRRRNQAQ